MSFILPALTALFYYNLQHTVYETIVRSRYNDLFTVSVLKICNVGPEDGGDYLCSARSGVVSASAPRVTTITVLHDEGQCNFNDYYDPSYLPKGTPKLVVSVIKIYRCIRCGCS